MAASSSSRCSASGEQGRAGGEIVSWGAAGEGVAVISERIPTPAGIPTGSAVVVLVGKGTVVGAGVEGVACEIAGGWAGEAQAARTKTNIAHKNLEGVEALRMAIGSIIRSEHPPYISR